MNFLSKKSFGKVFWSDKPSEPYKEYTMILDTE